MVRLAFIALVFLVIGILFLLMFLMRIIRNLSIRKDDSKATRLPGKISYIAVLFALIMFLISWAFFLSAGQLEGIRPYKPASTVGFIEVSLGEDNVRSIKIDYYTKLEDNLSVPTTFYLSGNFFKLEGQFLRFSGFLTQIFGWSHYYKISDFYSDFKGHKPPDVNTLILRHQQIEGGSAKIDDFISYSGFLGNLIDFKKFESKYIPADQNRKYYVVLSDSGEVSLQFNDPSE